MICGKKNIATKELKFFVSEEGSYASVKPKT